MLEAGPLCFALYCATLVYCHAKDTDGRIHISKIKNLLDFSAVEIDQANPTAQPYGPSSPAGDTGADPVVIADALVTAGLFEHDGPFYVVHDYLKHNASHAEREAARIARSSGGKKGAERRWNGSTDDPTHGLSDSPSHNSTHSPTNGPPDGSAIGKEEGIREKAKVYKAPPTPSLVEKPRQSDAINEEPDDGLQLAVQLGEFMQQDLKPLEIQECRQWLKDFAYLDVKSSMVRIREYAAKRTEQGHEPIRSALGYRRCLQSQNDWLADQGAAKKNGQERHGYQSTGAATLVGDLLQ